MPVLETAFGLVLLLAFFAVTAVPGLLLAIAGWKLCGRISDPITQRVLRSGLVALAATPTFYGHIGLLPAVWLLFLGDPIYGVIPIALFWPIAFTVMARRSRNKHAAA